jgi:hypothetical protein
MGVKVGSGASDATSHLTLNPIKSKGARNENVFYDGIPAEFYAIKAVVTCRLL